MNEFSPGDMVCVAPFVNREMMDMYCITSVPEQPFRVEQASDSTNDVYAGGWYWPKAWLVLAKTQPTFIRE